jgi:hypothetical protein
MSYAPLVHPAEIASQANPFARSPAINSLFNRCYGSDILPSRAQFPRTFEHKDVFANLYLSERQWVDEVDFPPEDAPDRHELYLDELFWSKDVAHGLICVLGAVGSGKSTLVDYYLRCYCGTKGRNRAEFDKKLIIHFDSKVIQDNTDFYHDFFLFAQASIRYQCSQKGFEIDVAIKRRPTQPNNVREWVWAALEELTRIAEKRDPAAPFHHIVLVVDNLDQTPPAVQIRAITEVEQWLLTPSIKLWRVFLPLWPSTYNSLRNHRFNLLRGASVFRIGSINHEFLLENYDRAAIDRLSASSSSLERQAVQYLREITALAKDKVLPRIERLAHGSLRLTLALWDGFLRSEGAYNIWRHAQAAPGSRRGYDYELLDALIVGAFSSLNHGFHRVANLFALGHARAKPRDILIGPHALKLMNQGVRSHRALADSLDTLGYSEQNVEHVVAGLGTFNVLHQVPSRGGLIEYELHDAVIAEYLQLLSEPAYLDDVAIVTPVDRSARESMYRTRGDRPDDFPARVESSISFLRFLRESEDRFRDPSQLRPGVDPDAFRQALTKNPLPCLWRRMAVEYKQRLIGLRNSGYLKTVDAAWWNKPLADPVLAGAEDAPDVLAPL